MEKKELFVAYTLMVLLLDIWVSSVNRSFIGGYPYNLILLGIIVGIRGLSIK